MLDTKKAKYVFLGGPAKISESIEDLWMLKHESLLPEIKGPDLLDKTVADLLTLCMAEPSLKGY